MAVTDETKLYVQSVKEEVMREVFKNRTSIELNKNDVVEIKSTLTEIKELIKGKGAREWVIISGILLMLAERVLSKLL